MVMLIYKIIIWYIPISINDSTSPTIFTEDVSRLFKNESNSNNKFDLQVL